ncbi:MAG TPA: hypothetical protein DCL61_09180 [Cyanobacteria bacterium UBA12227]|nr:hypothetical protein [Cyanobacteria bacterium UBA12227]HAX87007.1 hypothetical protein [Cyanobacteria bacterium UBA11370]HBY78995.1 hypothetical protein [Cyanobacteria bacterium UBA11148]
MNREKEHILVLPEDRANEEIANGFIQIPNVNSRTIKIERPAGGWKKVLKKFEEEHIAVMRQYTKSRVVLLIDFDQRDDRLSYVNSQIPDDLKERVFVLGVFSNPESLRNDVGKNFEGIGEALANNCSDNTNDLWEHELLKHNKIELNRMISSVKPFLFS